MVCARACVGISDEAWTTDDLSTWTVLELPKQYLRRKLGRAENRMKKRFRFLSGVGSACCVCTSYVDKVL